MAAVKKLTPNFRAMTLRDKESFISQQVCVGGRGREQGREGGSEKERESESESERERERETDGGERDKETGGRERDPRHRCWEKENTRARGNESERE